MKTRYLLLLIFLILGSCGGDKEIADPKKINPNEVLANADMLKQIKFEADIPGFVLHRQLVLAIKQKQILPQGSMLNGRTKMDAENYYILSNDFDKLSD